jgi:GTP-binding protein
LDLERINLEVERYAPALAQKPQTVVLNKMDIPETRELEPRVRAAVEEKGLPFFAVSAVTGEGLTELVRALADQVLGKPDSMDSGHGSRENDR